MRLHDIYAKEIDRPINGVIKVAQDDNESIEQELSEYVITRELRKHFTTFLNNYEQSIDSPTDKIGVWISGFFGSGKSHFLKMLSYLLSNQEVAGKQAITYFEDKFDDPMMYAQLEHCASVETDTILFNIDSKSPINKDATAILRVFAKVFYEHLGFYGNDLKVAKLEQHISKLGKMDEFKTKYEDLLGDNWENTRDAFAFYEDDIVEILMDVLGMSETAARNWFNGEETAELTIEQLVKEIREYINSRGKDYRLLFMVDEVGQYIGSDGSLMLNLQTIVEEIGSKCGGRVWVMVTSQEAIDSITKISGDDFSKIQGRFNTRLSLSSSSVDEVIKKRILAKTENAENMLRLVYAEKGAGLKSTLSFQQGTYVQDLKGYENEFEFVETYPFVPYQFRLIQDVLAQIRKHGNSGKHLSGGERSMLSGFQEAAQAIENKDENALVPFSLFYNTVHTFLESTIRRVIDRCQTAADNKDGIEDYDVSILKLLYLIRYVDGSIKGNVENIATLMVDDVNANKLNLRKKVQESLDRLVTENYAARNGDTYTFLTDDEQDIARDIKDTPVSSADITKKIVEEVYGNLYVSKKFKHDKYDFPVDQLIDETANGTLSGAMKLRLITVGSELYTVGDQRLIMMSMQNEAIMLLSNDYPYFDEIEQAMKIRKYVMGRNISQLPEAIQSIIRNRQQQASAYEKNAKELISKAIIGAKVYIHGEKVEIKGSTVKDKIDGALAYLVDSVYTKLTLIRKNYDSDAELLGIISDAAQGKLDIYKSPNDDAAKEVKLYLDLQYERHLPTSMGDIQRRFSAIPYGWREIDIAAVVTELVANQDVTIQYSGSTIQPKDNKLPDYLRRKSEIDKTIVSKRIELDPKLIKKSRDFLREYFNVMDVPADEDGLIAYVITSFTEQRAAYEELIVSKYNMHNYPEKSVVEEGIKMIDSLMAQKKDNTALLQKLVDITDDLLDLQEDMSDILSFFKNQVQIFDSARDMLYRLAKEKDYLQVEDSMMRDLHTAQSIIEMQKPYKRINELPTLMQNIENAYKELLDAKREDVYAEIQSAMAEIHQTAGIDQKDIVKKADDALQAKKNAVSETDNLTSLDAMKIQIQNIKQQYLKALIVVVDPVNTKKIATTNRSNICFSSKLESEKDVDEYVAAIKDKLMGMLEENDVVHII